MTVCVCLLVCVVQWWRPSRYRLLAYRHRCNPCLVRRLISASAVVWLEPSYASPSCRSSRSRPTYPLQTFQCRPSCRSLSCRFASYARVRCPLLGHCSLWLELGTRVVVFASASSLDFVRNLDCNPCASEPSALSTTSRGVKTICTGLCPSMISAARAIPKLCCQVSRTWMGRPLGTSCPNTTGNLLPGRVYRSLHRHVYCVLSRRAICALLPCLRCHASRGVAVFIRYLSLRDRRRLPLHLSTLASLK